MQAELLPLSFPSRDLGCQSIQFRFPESAEPLQPRIHILQGLCIHGVNASSAVNAHGREAIVTQDLEVLGDCRLRDGELTPNDVGDLARGTFSLCQELQDAASHRIAEHIERVHEEIKKARQLRRCRTRWCGLPRQAPLRCPFRQRWTLAPSFRYCRQ